jgi:hypothetical protein
VAPTAGGRRRRSSSRAATAALCPPARAWFGARRPCSGCSAGRSSTATPTARRRGRWWAATRSRRSPPGRPAPARPRRSSTSSLPARPSRRRRGSRSSTRSAARSQSTRRRRRTRARSPPSRPRASAPRARQRTHNGWSLLAGDTAAFGTDYVNRAIVARVGLGANVPKEAIYPNTDTDGDGRRLVGSRRYVISFPPGQLPPVGAFWSLTLYDDELHFAPNAIDRYAIGDRTAGLRYGKDGSLKIYVQRAAPPGAQRANWLPAPAGKFRLYLRLYEPKPTAVNGTWTLPTVARVR